jgi:flagellar motor protein MotB
MRWFTSAPWLLTAAAVLLSGCAENSLVLKGQLDKLQQEQLALSGQNQALQNRATALDRDNQDLQSLLAQSRQQTQVLEDQLVAVREQLRGVTTQLAQVHEEKDSSQQRVEALTASMRSRGSVSITPNNSLLGELPAIDLPDVHVRRDGDVIRVELPGSRLFDSGSARLQPGASEMIASAAAQLLAVYPVLVTRGGYRPDQLFVAGHGPNHPVVSNATAEGKQRNQRVELVVYPERRGEG